MAPVPLQRSQQGGVVRIAGGGPAHHDDVDRATSGCLIPEALSDQPLDAITVDCPRSTLARDREAEALLAAVHDPGRRAHDSGAARAREYREVTVRAADRVGEYVTKFAGALQPVAAGEPVLVCRCGIGIAAQGVRRARPLARRALITLSPLRVAQRARNPWVRARFRRLGLNVCFTMDPLRNAVFGCPRESARGDWKKTAKSTPSRASGQYGQVVIAPRHGCG
jgi:hypothetical protein